MNRTPPVSVIKELRQEVGFVCPVDGCENPFLSWHHFDPPWCEKNHHNPKGMVALCRAHHDQADNGAFTREQLVSLKASKNDNIVSAKFNWLRNKLLVNVGGNYHYEVTDAISIDGKRWIWFDRDSGGNLLLNFSMPSTDQKLRSVIRQNTWYELGYANDLICPPHGRLIKVTYPNGDMFKVEFNEMENGKALQKKYPKAPTSVTGIESPELESLWDQGKNMPLGECQIEYPVTVVEISITLKDGNWKITPSDFKGFNIKNCLFFNSPLNIKIKK